VIKRIGLSEKDQTTLKSLLESRPPADADPSKDFRGSVVLKPWGYEYLAFQNEHVAVWVLHIKHGHSTSMHCHPLKKTCLMLLSGSALCNTFYRRNFINGMGAVIIDKGVFHSTHALSDDGIDLIEIETPPNKTDLVRLNDAYGREASGYENESAMQTERLERFNYFYVDEGQAIGDVCANPAYRIGIRSFASDDEFRDTFRPQDGEYYASCRGRILATDGSLLLDVGEAQSGSALSARPGLRVSGPLFLLTVGK